MSYQVFFIESFPLQFESTQTVLGSYFLSHESPHNGSLLNQLASHLVHVAA